MNTWEELKHAVGQWSVANFGSQSGLGCLAPLMGMCEEVGELDSSLTDSDTKDAVGDVVIYLMDYCYRSGVGLWDLYCRLSPNLLTPAEAVGRLHHVQLKRLQGIRGMDADIVFEDARFFAVVDVLRSLVITERQPFAVAVEVWNTVVSKRKWHDTGDAPLSVESCTKDYQRVVKELNNLE